MHSEAMKMALERLLHEMRAMMGKSESHDHHEGSGNDKGVMAGEPQSEMEDTHEGAYAPEGNIHEPPAGSGHQASSVDMRARLMGKNSMVGGKRE